MNSLTVEGTNKTPGITADPRQGTIEIRGRSHPEDTAEFYRPLTEWVDEYIAAPADNTVISIDLEYCNTSSSKVILTILRKFEAIEGSRERVQVNWYYEEGDDDELETGEYYSQILNLGFKYIGI